MMNIKTATAADAARLTDLYNWYIANTTITFETEVVSLSDMKERIQKTVETYDWLIGEFNQELIGYAYYGAFRLRAAYSHTVESTIYLAPANTGKGLGTALYSSLIESAKQRGFRELVGVIALPNPQSTALHQKLGFAEMGVLKRVGHKFGQYIDVGLWQRSIL